MCARQHNEVACYRTERTLMRCADPLRRGSVHPISVLELTNNEVVGSSDVTGPICESARDYIAKKKRGNVHTQLAA